MLEQNKSYKIAIETGVKFFSAVFKREYTLSVESIDGDQVWLRVSSVDFVPSGYRDGGSNNDILDEYFSLKQIRSKYDNAKKLLAALAINHDKSLLSLPSCQHKVKSLSIISEHLESVLQKIPIEA